jgi:hypothetical protein
MIAHRLIMEHGLNNFPPSCLRLPKGFIYYFDIDESTYENLCEVFRKERKKDLEEEMSSVFYKNKKIIRINAEESTLDFSYGGFFFKGEITQEEKHYGREHLVYVVTLFTV